MNIESFKNHNYKKIFEADHSKREIGYGLYKNVLFTGRNHFYPNVLLFADEKLINPYDEKVMSLNKDSFYDDNIFCLDNNISIKKENSKNVIGNPVFFFVYNFDNYYHFLYDTLPYLVTFYYLKKEIPNLKIVINYPNKDKTEFYKFNNEFLEKLIDTDDLIIHNENNIYNEIYVSSSYTHGGYSNEPPRSEIFSIYDKLKKNVCLEKVSKKYIDEKNKYEKMYISRRTWINKDTSNIGTDYTSRRKMMNEDELVLNLEKNGFIEIFAENLNTDEKIYLFSNAKMICGSIGGGMSNLLFSNKSTKTIVLVTPYFLDINYRFRFSMDMTNITYFDKITTSFEEGKHPLFVRVQITNDSLEDYKKIGEIFGYTKENKYIVQLSNNDVAGFNQSIAFEKKEFGENDFKLLDKGLNSPYMTDIDLLLDKIKN